jgi:Transposase family tnp2.
MGILGIILKLASQCPDHQQTNQPTQIPRTITTALAKFKLDGRTTIYAVCPTCHCTYKPDMSLGTPNYPETCSNKRDPDSGICGMRLLMETRGGISTPIKTFVYYEFDDYLAALLARPDIEVIMDKRWETLKRLALDGEKVQDILTAEYLKSFHGPGESLFLDGPEGEGRFIFALNLDFFHPEGVSMRSDSTSCGVISMVCLNLPPDLRYKAENMYLAGIIPSSEPHLTEINHYLRPVIDSMVVSWGRGVRFSRTASRNGRMTRCAIAPVVCDLLAARKVAQLLSHSSHFYCSVCQCVHQSTLGRTDNTSWVPRDVSILRQQAEAWRDALTVTEQVKITAAHGVRWSELWRLPYWDPTRQLVVDPMHCLFEGVIHHHVREVLQLTEGAKAPPVQPAFVHNFTEYQEMSPLRLKEKEIKQVQQIQALLTAPIDQETTNDIVTDQMSSDDTDIASSSFSIAGDTKNGFSKLQRRLLQRNRSALAFVCRNELSTGPMDENSRRASKAELVNALLNWVSLYLCVICCHLYIVSSASQSH